VIQAIADGRRIAQAIVKKERHAMQSAPRVAERLTTKELLDRRSIKHVEFPSAELPTAQRHGFEEADRGLSAVQAKAEADRCLACSTMCSLCVTVCPNRANQMVIVDSLHVDLPELCVDGRELLVSGTSAFKVEQPYQVVNIADFCNECGNCTTFCPTSGAPYRDKPRVHLTEEGFEKANYNAFRLLRSDGGVRVLAKIDGAMHILSICATEVEYEGQGVRVLCDGNLKMKEADALEELEDGTEVDLRIAAQMFVIASAISELPE
jgi:putative selenate reductase